MMASRCGRRVLRQHNFPDPAWITASPRLVGKTNIPAWQSFGVSVSHRGTLSDSPEAGRAAYTETRVLIQYSRFPSGVYAGSPVCECRQRPPLACAHNPVCVTSSPVRRSAANDTTRENQMKKNLMLSAALLGLLIAGCNVNPAAAPAPGPAGPPGATGQQGAVGQTGDQGQAGDPGRMGDRGREGDQGQTGDQGQRGQAAPCPAGEHRHTNPDTGNVICVND